MSEISIIIPFYNAEKYMRRCLDAILAQKFSDFEVICVDDGSKDKTYQILQDYAKKDSRIKAYTQANGGPSVARRTALSKATGKYLMFCDSDDWYEPNMCQIMFDTIEQNDVDVVCCNTNVIDEIKDIKRIDKADYYSNTKKGIYYITRDIVKQTNVLLWNKIWKKSLVDKYLISFPFCREYDDDCFFLQYMSVAQKIMYIEYKLYNYFRRQDSVFGKVSQKKDTTSFDKLYSAKFYFDFLCKNNLLKEKENIFLDYLNGIYCFFSRKGWSNDNWINARHKFYELFSKNSEFENCVFPKEITFAKVFKIQYVKFLKQEKLRKKYAIKIGRFLLKF